MKMSTMQSKILRTNLSPHSSKGKSPKSRSEEFSSMKG